MPQEELHTAEQSLTAPGCRPTVAPETLPGAPTGLDLVCQGPWEYRQECYQLSNTSACPQDGWYQKACKTDLTCDYSTRSTVPYTDRKAAGQDVHRQDCDYSEKPPCTNSDTSSYTQTCAARATQLLAELRADNKEDPKYPLDIVSAFSMGDRVLGPPQTTTSSGSGWSLTVTTTPWTETCSITIANVATTWTNGQHPECGQKDDFCPDHDRPKYSYCRAPSHGVEADPATCDGLPGGGPRYSAGGLSQNTLKSTSDSLADIRAGSYPNRPRCLTADDTAYASVDTKYTRLVTQLESIGPTETRFNGPLLKFKIIDALKLLFELHADSPALDSSVQAGTYATRRARLLSLFAAYPDINHFFRVDPTVDFNWVREGPAPFMSPDTFSVRWTGFVEAPQAGTYTFHVKWDDTARLWVDGQLLLERPIYLGEVWHQVSVPLTVGRHALKLEHAEGGWDAGIHLYWQPPGATGATPIPTERLFTSAEGAEHGLTGEYFDNDNFTSDACSTGLPAPVASHPSSQDVLGTLTLCQRLLDSHVSATAASSLLDTCTASATGIQQLTSAGLDTQAYWTAYDTIMPQLLLKGLPGMTTTLGSSNRVGELRQKLISIQRWYGAARARESSTSAPSPELMAHASKVMRAFWMGAWLKDELSLTATTNAQAETVRAKMLSDGFIADRQVLLAAFGQGGTPPLTGAPLLFLLDDSLRGLNERMLDVSRLHDMGCRFVSCTTRSTVTSQLWNVLANLNDASEFETRVTAAVNVSSDWAGVFTQMKTGHGAFRSAVEDALGLPAGTYDKKDLFTQPVSGPAMSLTAMLREAQARATGYAVNGLFTAEGENTVKVGLDLQKQAAVLTELSRVIGQLDNNISFYNSNRATLVQGLLAQLQNQGSLTNLDTRRLQQDEQLKALIKDINGLRVSKAVEEARLGDFMDGFEALYPAIEQQGQAMLKFEHLLTVPNRGRGGPADTDVSSMAALTSNNETLRLKPTVGSQLVVQVTGRWSPTCALGLTAGPNGNLVRVRTSAQTPLPIMTGPEGFTITASAGNYTATANDTVNSEGNFSNPTNSDSFCSGFNPSIFGIGMGGVNSCMTSETGTTWSRTWNQTSSTGAETRSTFSAARGVRSLLVPFPDEPVGSLLLVETEPGLADRSKVRSVRVLQSPSTSLLVTAASDYYVVVNDAPIVANTPTAACQDWVGNSQLDVRVAELKPASGEAVLLASKLVSGLAKLKDEAKLYVEQGRLLPGQATSLRAKAFSDIFQECGCTSLEAYPESLRTFFDAFVEKALVDVEREVELVNLERQLRQLVLEIQAVEDERANAQTQSRLLALVPAWSLRNLEGTALRVQLEALEEVMSQWLAPTVRVVYPETLASFTNTERAGIEALTTIDPTSTSTDLSLLAQTAKDAARAVETHLSALRVAGPNTQVLDVIVSIPRHDKLPVTLYRKMESGAAREIWDDIRANLSPTVTLTPEYFYDPAGGVKQLPCNMMTPIIRSMTLFGVLPNNNSAPAYTTATSLTKSMSFPSVSDQFRYDFGNADYLGPPVQLMFGTTQDLALLPPASPLDYYLSNSSIASGLSPFTTYHVNLQSLVANYPPSVPDVINPNNPLAKSSELLMVFKVEVKPKAPGTVPNGVMSCQ
ncbi:PA14 domain-containing protein [Corallococcus sp. CA054B]|uniref:PA14 domain-containing protein n=1 Tax=Corallococcus sp. CA054B TaxID=2316734 RepID=UPI0013151268|nr:PA14 domain-containing protein [Corallococcus sp. CA054B]